MPSQIGGNHVVSPACGAHGFSRLTASCLRLMQVCDFGFAKQLTGGGAPDDPVRFCCTPSRSGALGTMGYVSPESMMTGEVSSASDVYSFGVVMLELLTGRKPLDFSLPDKDQSLVNWVRVVVRSTMTLR